VPHFLRHSVLLNNRATGRHLPYEITQCYLLPDTSERARLSVRRKAGTRFPYPKGAEGLDDLVTYRDGIGVPALSHPFGRSVMATARGIIVAR